MKFFRLAHGLDLLDVDLSQQMLRSASDAAGS